MRVPGELSAVELLGAAIHALAHADAAQLEGLAASASEARISMTAEEGKIARERMRTLGHLILLTRRNLRLLRGTGRDTYGLTRG